MPLDHLRTYTIRSTLRPNILFLLRSSIFPSRVTSPSYYTSLRISEHIQHIFFTLSMWHIHCPSQYSIFNSWLSLTQAEYLSLANILCQSLVTSIVLRRKVGRGSVPVPFPRHSHLHQSWCFKWAQLTFA